MKKQHPLSPQHWAIKLSKERAESLLSGPIYITKDFFGDFQRGSYKDRDFYYFFADQDGLTLIGWSLFSQSMLSSATEDYLMDLDFFEKKIELEHQLHKNIWTAHPIFQYPSDTAFLLNNYDIAALNKLILECREQPPTYQIIENINRNEQEKQLKFLYYLTPKPSFFTRALISFAVSLSEIKKDKQRLLSSECLLYAFLAPEQLSPQSESNIFQKNKTFIKFLNTIVDLNKKQYSETKNSYLDLQKKIKSLNFQSLIDGEYSLDSKAREIILEASRLSQNYNFTHNSVFLDPIIEGPYFFIEHLWAAILIVPNTGAIGFLQETGWTVEVLRKKFFEFISIENPNDAATWRKILFPKESTSHDTNQKTQDTHQRITDVHGGESIPDISSDEVGSNLEDLIGTEKEAESMARFVASKHISPPLSIGLFGDWGSGKSFFMQKMIKHVENFTKKDNDIFHKKIVPIEFNAWHYIETNLWASLVSHIFETLEIALSDKNPSEEKKFEKLIAELETAKKMKGEARQKKYTAIKNLNKTKRKIKETQSQYNNAISKQSALKSKDLWEIIGEVFKSELTAKDKNKIKETQKNLGLTNLIESAKDLNTIFQEAKSVTGRAQIIFSSVFTKNGSQYVVLFGLIVLMIPLGGEIIDLFKNRFPKLPEALAETGTLLATFTSWIGIYANKASRGLGKLELIKTTLDNAIQTVNKNHQDNLKEIDEQVLDLQAKLDVANDQFKQANQNFIDAQRNLKEGSARGRLRQFIKEKASSEKYSKHLGIVAMIRKDFETLTKLMRAVQLQDKVIEPNPEDPDDEKITKQWKEILSEIPKFDRIVLYIDDLDRCPAEKVVEVLQAVHLLLAFRLFVVVVGIDARWISHSLKKVYPSLLSEDVNFKSPNNNSSQTVNDKNGNSNRPAAEHAASSHDYLEKIFQIPYWVRPMTSTNVENYIVNLTRQKKPQTDNSNSGDLNKSDQDQVITDTNQETNPEKTTNTSLTLENPSVIQSEGNTENNQEVKEEKFSLENEEVEALKKLASNIPTPRKTKRLLKTYLDVKTGTKETDNPKETKTESFTLEDDEIQFMTKLSPYVGTSPRRVKRFVNTYRIVKAGIKNDDLEDFLKNINGTSQFQAVMVQLAIVVGTPHVAPFYFEALNQSKSFDDFKILFKKAQEDEDPDKILPWDLVNDALEKSGIEDTKLLSDWAGWVMRYSFHCRPIGDFQ